MSSIKWILVVAIATDISVGFAAPYAGSTKDTRSTLTYGESYPAAYMGSIGECNPDKDILVGANQLYVLASNPEAIVYTCVQNFKATGVNQQLEFNCDLFAMRLSCKTESFVLTVDGESKTFCNRDSSPDAVGESINIVYTRTVSSFYGGYVCSIMSTSSTNSTTNDTSEIVPWMSGTNQSENEIPSGQLSNTIDYCKICGRDAPLGTRIIGGKNAEKSYPWMAVLIIKISNDAYICGGSLIASDLVLTAAHCVQGGVKDIKVLLGKRDLTNVLEAGALTLRSSTFFAHPEYNSDKVINDVALIRIPKVQFTVNIKPICLPPDGAGSYQKQDGKAIGFGLTSKEDDAQLATVLQEVDLGILAEKNCAQRWRRYGVKIVPSHLCALANDKSTCSGDSGGPIMVKVNGQWTAVGLTSFGFATCAHRGTPSVFTRVSSFRSWIGPYFQDASCK